MEKLKRKSDDLWKRFIKARGFSKKCKYKNKSYFLFFIDHLAKMTQFQIKSKVGFLTIS